MLILRHINDDTSAYRTIPIFLKKYFNRISIYSFAILLLFSEFAVIIESYVIVDKSTISKITLGVIKKKVSYLIRTETRLSRHSALLFLLRNLITKFRQHIGGKGGCKVTVLNKPCSLTRYFTIYM